MTHPPPGTESAILFDVEIRESSRAGYEPQLHGVMIQEGRAASGGRAEVFAPGSIEWPSQGVSVLTRHHGETETRGQVIRQRDGRLTLTARATEGIRDAVKSGKRFLSVEFKSLREQKTRGGVREVLRAFVDAAALVRQPEYQQATAEVRSRRKRAWL